MSKDVCILTMGPKPPDFTMQCPIHGETTYWDENEPAWYCWKCGMWHAHPYGETYLGNGRWKPNLPQKEPQE